MKITGPCEECKEKQAVVGLNGRKLCMKCYEAALAAVLEPAKRFANRLKS